MEMSPLTRWERRGGANEGDKSCGNDDTCRVTICAFLRSSRPGIANAEEMADNLRISVHHYCSANFQVCLAQSSIRISLDPGTAME